MKQRFFALAVGLACCVSLMAAGGAFARAVDHTGEIIRIVTDYESTLLDVARDHNLGYVEIVAANPGVDPWLPGEGTEVVVPSMHLLPDAGREGIVINLPEMRLYKFDSEGAVAATYPVGIGREGWKTPLGETSIVRRKAGPSWYPTENIRAANPELPRVVPPGPDNPLGTHALYLGWPAYLIHGTAQPWGVGRRVSSGCIRLYPEDIPKLFEAAPDGTRVEVVNQPVKVGWIDGRLHLEVHPSIAQADAVEAGEEPRFAAPAGLAQMITARAGEHVLFVDWAAVRTALDQRLGIPVPVTPVIHARLAEASN